MISRVAERSSGLAALVCALATGLTVLLELTIATYPGPPAAVWWWTAYLLYLLVLLVLEGFLPRPRRVPEAVLASTLVVLGVSVFLLYPDQGWTAIILAVTAAVSASVWSPRVVAGVIAVQTAAVVAGVVSGGWPLSDVIISVVAYGAFQWFGALVMWKARREREARRELAIAHAELRAASALMATMSRDAERLRIARDLHDVVGHHLTVLALELEVSRHLVSGDGAEHVTRAHGVAKDLLADVRAAVGQMRSSCYSLEQLLRSLVAEVPGLDITLDVRTGTRIEGEEATVVLRCVQEAITNALRHGDAEHVWITVSTADGQLRVDVRDDGLGTDDLVPGNGLRGMRERFEALGGSLEVRTSPGAGFATCGRLPIAASVGGPRE